MNHVTLAKIDDPLVWEAFYALYEKDRADAANNSFIKKFAASRGVDTATIVRLFWEKKAPKVLQSLVNARRSEDDL